MLEWILSGYVGVLAVVLIVMPGLAVGYASGLRGLLAWGTAPLLSAAVIGITAIGAGAVGVGWGIVPVIVVTLAVTAAALGVRAISGGWTSPHLPRENRAGRRAMLLWVGGASLVASGLEARRLIGAIGSPEHIAQTYDTSFHLNSLAMIADTGDASTLHMTLATPGRSVNFYPALWHDIVSLVSSLSGTGSAVAANWVAIVIATVIWPLSALVLARVLFGPRPLLLALSAVLAMSFTQFPNQLVGFGILYPNLLSYALMPALLGLALLVLTRLRSGRALLAPLWLAGIGAVALALAQPNALFTIGYVLIPVLAWRAAHATARLARRRLRWWLQVVPWLVFVFVTVGAYVLAGQIQLVSAFRETSNWEVELTPPEAIKDALSLAALHPEGTPNVAVAILVAIGFVAAMWVERWRWLPAAYAILVALFVVAISVDAPIREQLTGYWYTDAERLAAQLPLIGVPLAVIGAWVVSRGIRDAVRGRAMAGSRCARAATIPAVVVLVAIVISVVLPRTMVYRQSFQYVADTYSLLPDPWVAETLVDAGELEMMDVVRREVPEGVSVAGDPWNGSALTWALADRESIYPHTKVAMDPDRALIAESLNDALVDPAVCDAVERLGLGYVLDLGGRHLWDREVDTYDGLSYLVGSGVAEIEAVSGPSVLYRITACE